MDYFIALIYKKNIAHHFPKCCPSFRKTLPVKMENVARVFFKRCPSFWKMTGNENDSLAQMPQKDYFCIDQNKKDDGDIQRDYSG